MRIATITTIAAAALALGACGDDKETTTSTPAAASGGGGESLSLTADPGGALKFNQTELTAKAGKVKITLVNPSNVPHAIEVEGNGVEAKGETVQKGGTSTATADLKPGTYDYYCPVGDHRAEGMEGKLTIS
jgi:plastocyanin